MLGLMRLQWILSRSAQGLLAKGREGKKCVNRRS